MKKHSGQTLIEMVVAVGMVSLVLVAIVAGIAISIRNSRFSKNKALATRFAQEGIEKFRFYRDEFGWIPFFETINGQSVGGYVEYCFDDFPTGLEDISDSLGNCTTETISGTEYTRYAQVNVTTLPSDFVDILVGVTWIEGAAPHSVELTTRLNDWTKK
jgi:type II secretory pathway pseudopilin PulG